MQLDGAIVIRVRDGEDLFAHRRLDRKLFAKLAAQTGFQRFARVTLASRKFPETRKVNARLPAS